MKKCLTIIPILFLIIFLAGSVAAWDASLDSGLVAGWAFNDASGDNVSEVLGIYHGERSASMVDGDWVTGILGNALEFDGVNDFVNLTSLGTLGASDEITVSFWMNTTGTGADDKILGLVGAGTEPFYQVTFADGITLTNSIRESTGGDALNKNISGVFNDNDWHHFVIIVKNTINQMHFYFDGVNMTTTSNTVTSPDTFANWAIEMTLGAQNNNGAVNAHYEGLVDELYFWNRTLTETEALLLWNSGTGISKDNPVTLNSPSNNSNLINTTVEFQSTSTTNDIANSTLLTWFSNSTIFNNTVNSSTSSIAKFNLTNFIIGKYLWNVRVCNTLNICNWATNNYSFTWGISDLPSVTLNSTANDLYREEFNVSLNSTASSVTGDLIYNGTRYAATATNTGNFWELRTSLTPTTAGTINVLYEINADGFKRNTSISTQTVTKAILAPCNSTLTIPYANFTFTNETIAAESTTGTITSTWNYWGNSATNFKTLSFTNSTENSWYAFCFEPNITIHTNLSLTYANSISEQRSYVQSSLSLSNTSSLSQALFLLPSANGIFVTFQVIDVADQLLVNVNVNVTKSGNLISSGITNDAGLVTFFLDPDDSYTLIFSKAGFTDVTTTLIPSQTSYTVTMGSGTSTTVDDYTRGIAYHILPVDKTLAPATTYTFSFELGSSFWTVSSFGFGIRNITHLNTLNWTSVATNGGTATLTLNTSTHTALIIDAFWIVDGNITNISDPYWIFDNSSTNYSIKNFIDRVKFYLGSKNENTNKTGMFGLSLNDDSGNISFSLALIIYFIIFIFVGIMSFKFGINTPIAMAFLLFSLVYFFDVILGLMAWLPGKESLHLPTVITFIALVGWIIKEART